MTCATKGLAGSAILRLRIAIVRCSVCCWLLAGRGTVGRLSLTIGGRLLAECRLAIGLGLTVRLLPLAIGGLLAVLRLRLAELGLAVLWLLAGGELGLGLEIGGTAHAGRVRKSGGRRSAGAMSVAGGNDWTKAGGKRNVVAVARRLRDRHRGIERRLRNGWR